MNEKPVSGSLSNETGLVELSIKDYRRTPRMEWPLSLSTRKESGAQQSG